MNLHGIVRAAIGTVNPHQPVILRRSAGYTTSPSGRQVPAYEAPVTVRGQVQSMTTKDLRQLEALNVQNSEVAIYLDGFLDGVVRMSQKGGDLIETQDGKVWLTTNVLEQWPDWVKVAVTLQNGS